MSETLFVYGTLRRGAGHRMHDYLLQHAECLGSGVVRGLLFLVRDYPGAVLQPDAPDTVRGDVFALQDAGAVLRVLDEYEGFTPGFGDPLFRRELVNVELDSGGRVQAWIYVYSRSTTGLTRIPGGDYLEFRKRSAV